MKPIVILGLITGLLNLGTMAFGQTEKQKYEVIHKNEDLEIRFYPSATLATVYSTASSYAELSGSGFRKLAGYIFGGNENDTKIAMTAPVHMDINDSLSSMSFVMPAAYRMENLPEPNDTKVRLHRTEDEYVAAVRFRGYASDREIGHYSEILRGLLDEEGIQHYGPFRYLGYNPPYQPFGRRNEIIVSVRWPERPDPYL